MNEEQELTEATRLLYELHKLGGPNPAEMQAKDILSRYRQLLAAEATQSAPDGPPPPD